MDGNGAFPGEVQGIGLQPQENLHYSLLISRNNWAFEVTFIALLLLEYILIAIRLSYLSKFGVELNFELISKLSLNTHDFFDGLSDVKGLDIFPELASSDLSVVQQVLNQKAHDIG